MNRKIMALAAAALTLGLLGTVSTPWAQAQKRTATAVIAVVDVNQITQSAEAAKSIKTQIDKVRASYQQTLQTKNGELQKLDEELQRQQTLLSPDAYQQKQKDFEQKVADAQRNMQDRRNKLETAFGSAMQQVEATLAQIVGQIAKEQGVTLVVPRAAIMYAEPDMDITPEVLKRLNAKLPSVAVTIPK